MIKPESEEKVAGMFNRIASKYDFLNALLSANQDKRWRKFLLGLVPEVKDGVMLDVATGTGDVVIGAAKARPEYKQFHGADISESMLSFAKEKTSQAGFQNKISYHLMSAEKIELPDNSVDCVSISFGLRNVVQKENALKEFIRVLKPGGTLLILDFFIPKKGFMSFVFQFYFHYILPNIAGIFSDKSAYQYLPKSVKSFYAPLELQASMKVKGGVLKKQKKWIFGSCRLFCFIKDYE